MTDIRTFPQKAILVTEKASLHITIHPFTNRDTGVIEHYSVNIGSRKTKCVQIIVPGESGLQEGKLNWVAKIVPECYLTAKDKTKLSQHIVNLAFTIARDINPTCIRYLVDDCSSFPCSLPDGKTQTIPMKSFHIAFHGSTWYEHYFGAKLVQHHETYKRLKLNLYDSEKKPPTFSFNNPDLDEILTPIYESTKTWHDFFQAIQSKYGDKKCGVLYPWITNAMYVIFDGSNIFDNNKWYIDLEHTSKIPFRSYEDRQTGGMKRKFTRKYKKPDVFFKAPPFFLWNYFEIQSMNYNKFLHS
jgi:hypothetical protein